MSTTTVAVSKCLCGQGCNLRKGARESSMHLGVYSSADVDARFKGIYGVTQAEYWGREVPADEPAPMATKPSGIGVVDPVAKARLNEAIAYMADYTGTFGLILDLKASRAWGSKHFRMSERQVEAVLASKARDEARKVERKQTGRDLTALPYGRTAAAVENESGALTFLLIDRPGELDRYKQPNKWHGWVFVKQFIGGVGEGQRLGSQRPGESYSGQWANLVDKVLADPAEAIARFGRELGICGVCMLPLTNEESRLLGIGPVCRSKAEAI